MNTTEEYLDMIDIGIRLNLTERYTHDCVGGREFTVIATKPYVGPNAEELERRKQNEQDKAQAIQRGKKVTDQKESMRKDAMIEEMRRKILGAMNKNHVGCGQCPLGTVCPGFIKDVSRPTTCKFCLHDRRRHDLLRKPSDAQFTFPRCLELMQQLDMELSFTDIKSKYSDMNADAIFEEFMPE